MTIKSLTILIVLAILTGCSESNNSSESSKKSISKQEMFCAIITDSKKLYISEKEKYFYLDQESEIQKIYSQRTLQLKTLLGNGSVSGWNGKIGGMTVSKGKGVYLKINLSCKVTLEPNDSLIIPINSELYQKLRKFSKKSSITFSGNFIPPPNSDKDGKYPHEPFYGEMSFTKNGSMKEPEFLFKFTAFH